MPIVKPLPVDTLKLDPKNFRHMPQGSEEKALHAMSALDTPYFWGLARGLLENGYVPRENIIVLKTSPTDASPLVKEGNRRIGILKLALGLLKGRDLDIPPDIADLLGKLTPDWKKKNASVPCLVYEPSEKDEADEVVDLTHGKGQLAARLDWNAVARARHTRDRGGSEPSLDLLEAYVAKARNLSPDEKEKWAADYPLTILLNAMNVLHPRLGFKSNRELANAYPKLPTYRGAFEEIVCAIGRGEVKTDDVRSVNFGVDYGIPLPQAAAASQTSTGTVSKGTTTLAVSVPGAATAAPGSTQRFKAVPIHSQIAVRRMLRKLVLVGSNRDKLVTIRDEALTLVLKDHPHSFCFLVRTMFELSAKAYCDDHKTSGGPKATAGGNDRPLADVIKDVYQHMTNLKIAASPNGKVDKIWQRTLHGAMAELTTPNSLFSITSMNQLVHHQTFTMTEKHIGSMFANVFPMLEEMNR